MITIYHNPRCGKSRAALKVLQDLGLDIQIVEYLKTPPLSKAINGASCALKYASL